jgi:Domain of unknown function (DUF397)
MEEAITMKRDLIIGPWVKSSYSNSGANCVETARTTSGGVAVRDSKHPDAGCLYFTVGEWREFIARCGTRGTGRSGEV